MNTYIVSIIPGDDLEAKRQYLIHTVILDFLSTRDATISKKEVKDREIKLPAKIFQDRTLSFMEAAVTYMKEELLLTYHDIAMQLNRDDRTIWTVYNRARKKKGGVK